MLALGMARNSCAILEGTDSGMVPVGENIDAEEIITALNLAFPLLLITCSITFQIRKLFIRMF